MVLNAEYRLENGLVSLPWYGERALLEMKKSRDKQWWRKMGKMKKKLMNIFNDLFF